ncbi:MAG: adenylosuccinate lyase [Candidatus Dormibacteraeota bacterium]|nr:adenylosuccinate lyase [Candidatus Dormibacteraeota bacterium]
MIDRYAPPDLRALWSDEARVELWLQVELAVCQARADLGEIAPPEMAALKRATPPSLTRLRELEAEQGHDLAAFVSAVQEQLGPEGRLLHLGLTSQDVVDTTLALQLRRVAEILAQDLARLDQALADLALRHRGTPMMGRTHGMHAEPLTFGFVMANHLDELRRAAERLRAATAEVVVGKVSGTVGTHATVSPEVERLALAGLGLPAAAITTQVVARDRHAFFLCALALVGASCERLATTLRHLQRTEVGEVEEPFAARQKGSSAMPHKRNPIRLEQVCGLSRLLRGWAVAGLEDVALWHERDISHSSVERVALPDATMALGHMVRTLTSVLGGLEVDREAMLANVERRGGLARSQQVLLALLGRGQQREEAYRLVQRLAHEADHEGGDFRAGCLASPELSRLLTAADIEEALALDRYLGGIDASFHRLGLLPATSDEAGDPPAQGKS